ncbi:MAG TPA: class I SAM-dependent methyltransferase [Polyangiaceae bacterium]|nr:class I SAM-dependent methyltransferase [Polyangiaceae bacterium]
MTELEAELYALTHRGNPGDGEFYARQCAGVGSVLELGTGYGRLLPALLGAAHEVVGLDRERSLLRAARRRLPGARGRLSLVEADMQTFALGRRFDRILLPYNALYCLLGRRALVSCFRSVRAHLAPGGTFCFDVWAADSFQRRVRRREAQRDEPGAIVSLAHRGQIWDVFERSRLRSASQRLDVTYTYVSRQRGTRVQIPIAQRYATSWELKELLARAGLRLRARWGGFSGQPFGPSSELFVAVACA